MYSTPTSFSTTAYPLFREITPFDLREVVIRQDHEPGRVRTDSLVLADLQLEGRGAVCVTALAQELDDLGVPGDDLDPLVDLPNDALIARRALQGLGHKTLPSSEDFPRERTPLERR
jgi:hypothetical protein